MLRQTFVRSSRMMANNTRAFSASVPQMVEDASGPGGVQKDAFSKREKASEDKYVHDQEMAKLKALKEKLETQRTNIGDLIKNIDDMSAEQNAKNKK